MSPLATYSDKSHAGVRTYQLFPTHVAVTHSDTIRVSAGGNIPLTELNPDYERIAVRTSFMLAGIWLTLVPALIYWALIELTRLDAFGTFPGFFLAMSFAGFFMFLVGLKKQHLVRFRTYAGVPALEVFREGPQQSEFDGFIQHMQDAIRAAQTK